MSDTENMPIDAVTHKVKVSEQYKEDALKQIKELVKGNQFNPDDIVIDSFEGEILHFKAETMLHLYTKVHEKDVPGRLTGPQLVKDESAAREEMDKAYASIANNVGLKRQITDVISKREDLGFALDKHVAPLPFVKKEFVYFEQCGTCKATGSVTCQHCHGQGTMLCPNCHGSGMEGCHHCNGAQTVEAQNGQRIPCPVCHGQGKSTCSSCQGARKIKCKVCASRGVTKCPNCEGHAWSSHLYTQEYNIRTEFDYPKSKLPEKVAAMVESYGAKISEHAEIKIVEDKESVVNIDDEDKQKKIEDSDRKKHLRFPIIYEVVLPYGHFEYNIKGKSYYTFLFGKHGRLTHVSPFLDDVVKQGVRKLKDAAEGRGDVAKNIVAASKYKTVKQGIYFTTRYSARKAQKHLKDANRIGLSDGMITKIVELSSKAIDNITEKPRYIGLGLSGVLHAVMMAIYLLSPLRDKMTSFVFNPLLHSIIDGLVVAGSSLLGVLLIQGVAQQAVVRVMSVIIPDMKRSAVAPKLGRVAYYNVVLAVFVFIALLQILRMAGIYDVIWYHVLIAWVQGGL